MLYDVFISHASEDKDSLVRPLAEALRDNHVEVWYDEFSLQVGDSLRRSIDCGVAKSRFGVVVLSPAFFAKEWPQRELDGLVARENMNRGALILPVWHNVSKFDVLAYSPSLADKVGILSERGLDVVLQKLLETI
ncbi:MAG: toll/interleukin-1 receptor domain-containing protein [Chlorobium sp.]|nr:MAG: toll/interleukin-1 receptor domain-containing protein [Chlorobium sp.]